MSSVLQEGLAPPNQGIVCCHVCPSPSHSQAYSQSGAVFKCDVEQGSFSVSTKLFSDRCFVFSCGQKIKECLAKILLAEDCELVALKRFLFGHTPKGKNCSEMDSLEINRKRQIRKCDPQSRRLFPNSRGGQKSYSYNEQNFSVSGNLLLLIQANEKKTAR